ncbi:MAG: hypothetical protein AAB562_00040 [Patescibacteria group bacterium]
MTEQILKGGRITAPGESPSEMVERVVSAFYEVEAAWTNIARAKRFADAIGTRMDERKIVFSTPVMTNALPPPPN